MATAAERVDREESGLLRGFLRSRAPSASILVVLGAFAFGLLAGLLVIAASGISPIRALTAMFDGSLGSKAAFGDSLVYATPRLFVALGAIVALRSGVFNVGGEGQLQLGAVGATLVATSFGSLAPILHVVTALAAACAFGAAWAIIAIIPKLWRGTNEIIVTLMMNFVAVYFVNYLAEGPLQPHGSTYNTSAPITPSARLPIILGGTRVHAGFALALVMAAAVSYFLYRTPLGLQLRATGLGQASARVQGLSTARLVLIAMGISGAISGLAGAGEVLGVQFSLIEGFSSNFGFEGLAIAFLAGLEPIAAVLVAIYFGLIESGTTELQTTLSIPGSLASVMVALPMVFLAAGQGWILLRGRSARG